MLEKRSPTNGRLGSPGELGGHLFAHQFGQGIRALGAWVDRLVDRSEQRRRVEWEAEDGLARGPYDPLHRRRHGSGEDVEGRDCVDPKRLGLGPDPWSRYRGQMDHRIGTGDELLGLTGISQVGDETKAVATSVVRPIDVAHVVTTLPQVANHPPTCLPATTGHHDLHRLAPSRNGHEIVCYIAFFAFEPPRVEPCHDAN